MKKTASERVVQHDGGNEENSSGVADQTPSHTHSAQQSGMFTLVSFGSLQGIPSPLQGGNESGRA